ALGSVRLRRRWSPERLVRVAATALAAGAAIVAISPLLPLTMAALVLAGAGWVSALSTFNVSVQMAAPRWVVARAVALYQMAAFGGMAAGSWLFGSVAERSGITTALLAAAGVQLLSVLAGFRLPLRDIETANLAPRGWEAPDTAVPVEARSGPVVVTIDYRIAPADVVGFLNVMNERRRIRRRDGAHHWALLRDLNDPELWIERYHVSTWLDYIRHNQRRTEADRANSEALLALHRGAEPPRVHRMIERQTGSLPVMRLPTPREMADPMTDPTRSN
ncbi:MFS transporter, partial [Nostoc sp. 3335mG]